MKAALLEVSAIWRSRRRPVTFSRGSLEIDRIEIIRAVAAGV